MLTDPFFFFNSLLPALILNEITYVSTAKRKRKKKERIGLVIEPNFRIDGGRRKKRLRRLRRLRYGFCANVYIWKYKETLLRCTFIFVAGKYCLPECTKRRDGRRLQRISPEQIPFNVLLCRYDGVNSALYKSSYDSWLFVALFLAVDEIGPIFKTSKRLLGLKLLRVGND